MLNLSKEQTLRMIRRCSSLQSTPKALIDHLIYLKKAERRERIRVNDPRLFAVINQYDQFMVSFQSRIYENITARGQKGGIFYMG